MSSPRNEAFMNKKILASLLALPLVAPAAFAQETSGFPAVKISGFGTGALTWTNEDRAQFARPNQVRAPVPKPLIFTDGKPELSWAKAAGATNGSASKLARIFLFIKASLRGLLVENRR